MASDADQSEAEEARVIREMEFEDKITRLHQQLAEAREEIERLKALIEPPLFRDTQTPGEVQEAIRAVTDNGIWEGWNYMRHVALREHWLYMVARDENAAMRALLGKLSRTWWVRDIGQGDLVRCLDCSAEAIIPEFSSHIGHLHGWIERQPFPHEADCFVVEVRAFLAQHKEQSDG